MKEGEISQLLSYNKVLHLMHEMQTPHITVMHYHSTIMKFRSTLETSNDAGSDVNPVYTMQITRWCNAKVWHRYSAYNPFKQDLRTCWRYVHQSKNSAARGLKFLIIRKALKVWPCPWNTANLAKIQIIIIPFHLTKVVEMDDRTISNNANFSTRHTQLWKSSLSAIMLSGEVT